MFPSLPFPRFNPLHCGAVVASYAVLESLLRTESSFNPLHCGAVVASLYDISEIWYIFLVSIPFIAGQWSLLWLCVFLCVERL